MKWDTFWTAAAAVVVFLIPVIGWAITIERRMAARLTRREHAEVCDRSQKALGEKVDQVLARLQEDRAETREHRRTMYEAIGGLNSQVANIEGRMSAEDKHRTERQRSEDARHERIDRRDRGR